MRFSCGVILEVQRALSYNKGSLLSSKCVIDICVLCWRDLIGSNTFEISFFQSVSCAPQPCTHSNNPCNILWAVKKGNLKQKHQNKSYCQQRKPYGRQAKCLMGFNKSTYEFLRYIGDTYLIPSIIRTPEQPEIYSETRFTCLIAVPNSLLLAERY